MHATAKVSYHIPDISPTLTLRRDKVHTTYPSTRKRYIQPSMDVIQEIDYNYAWNKLPNLEQYKSALVRNKVCHGLMYLLPGNKSGTSIARPYTADLGAIFEEPYHRFKPADFDGENLKKSSFVHFSPNTHESRLHNYKQMKHMPDELNVESQRSYNEFNALVVKNKDESTEEGGKGNLPVVAKVSPAELQLKEEVNKILDDVGITSDKDHTDMKSKSTTKNNPSVRFNVFNKSTEIHKRQHSVIPVTDKVVTTPTSSKVSNFRGQQYVKKSANFKDYRQLREAEPPRPQLPESLRSQYLSEQRAEEIWNWLHWDFKKTKFEHFLEVCS